ncbi:MAG: hypothetical protein B7X12_09385 [Halothiobacillus sp. 20-53-49]|nr:MAG: hypothetical protein B7X12_09385 [Halothiobacillus sp. 20-53-49]
MLIPEGNRKDLVEIPDKVKANLDIRPVRWIDEVLDLALVSPPTPKPIEPALIAVRDEGKRGDEVAATAH